MNASNHAAIHYPDVIPAANRIPAPAPSMALLYAAQDDMASYAQTLPKHVKPSDIDELTTQAERKETTLRRMVSDADFTQALDWLHERAELPDWVWARMEEVAMEFAEKRLNREQA
jgi:hypothetical protein